MKTAHRQAARAKAAHKHELFSPGTDFSPQEQARRKRRAQERTPAPDAWQQSWQPLQPTPAPPRRPGADDYLQHPSRIGDERIPYAAATPCPTRR